VVKHVKDTGEGTNALPQLNMPGYWKLSEGYYQFIKGSGNEEKDVEGKGLTKRETAWGRGVYTVDTEEESKRSKGAKQGDSYEYVNDVLVSHKRDGKEVTAQEEEPQAVEPGSKEAQDAAAAVYKEHTTAVSQATAAMRKLAEQAGALERNAPFTKRGG
jgi:hypothetical protein